MGCPVCGDAELRESVQAHRYDESGLPDVVLHDVRVSECRDCGYRRVGIPWIADLHRTIAAAIIRKPAQLVPQEIVFLRKSLGWTQAALASKLHFNPATVNRWERGKECISDKADVTLRLAVALCHRVEGYSVDSLDRIAASAAEPLAITLRREADRWSPTT